MTISSVRIISGTLSDLRAIDEYGLDAQRCASKGGLFSRCGMLFTATSAATPFTSI